MTGPEVKKTNELKCNTSEPFLRKFTIDVRNASAFFFEKISSLFNEIDASTNENTIMC